MASALNMLQSGEVTGSEWDDLVKLWEHFETQHEPTMSQNLASKYRPRVVGDWIQRARAATYRPSIDLEKYPAQFSQWWRSLQPGWRIRKGKGLVKDSGDLEVLRRSGSNGMLSVMAALFFWGVALGPARAGNLAWCDEVRDVKWVLEQLVAQS